jgi:predicted TIM-barrel fold metal-dependent hydrolase
MPIIAQAHLISLISEGVFERFPRLKIVLQEMGYAWVPGVMWRLDQEWRSLRTEIPWVKRPPSEYILERVRFTSQPNAEPPEPEQHLQILEMMHAEETLLFSSDYPHWDFDNPRQVFREAPDDLRKRIYSENAAEFFGLEF